MFDRHYLEDKRKSGVLAMANHIFGIAEFRSIPVALCSATEQNSFLEVLAENSIRPDIATVFVCRIVNHS